MWKAFTSMWKNTFNYKGKTSRKDFWCASVMNVIAMYAALIPVALVILILKLIGLEHLISPTVFSVIHIAIFIVPLLSLYVRRANDVGLKPFDILFTAIAVPVVGAMIVCAYPSASKVPYKGASWCWRFIAIGFGLYLYGGIIGVAFLGSFDAVVPIVGIGLALSVIAMVTGAILAKKDE